jgi:hypothetical protein
MIPQWVAGAAARDAMLRQANRGGGSPDGGSAGSPGRLRGVLSFVGVVAIAGAAFSRAWAAQLGGFASLAIAVAIGYAAFWAAYRTRGWVGVAAGIGFPILSGFAAHYLQIFLNDGFPVDSWLWPILVLVAVGIDQMVMRVSKR